MFAPFFYLQNLTLCKKKIITYLSPFFKICDRKLSQPHQAYLLHITFSKALNENIQFHMFKAKSKYLIYYQIM